MNNLRKLIKLTLLNAKDEKLETKQHSYCCGQSKLEKKLKEQSSEIIKQGEQIELLKTHVVRIFELLEFYGM